MSIDRDAFTNYLQRRGLSSRTIDQYVFQVSAAYTKTDPLERLTARSLAPKTRHVVRAALTAYARFRRDDELRAELAEVRLPPAKRTNAKVPLSETAWQALHAEVETRYLDDTRSAIVGVMERRGLRLGDVLRLRRVEIDRALSSNVLTYEVKGSNRLEFGVLPTYRRYLEALQSAFPSQAPGQLVSQLVTDGKSEAAADRSIQRHLSLLADEAGIGHVHPHQLRRTYAVWFYRKCGRDLEALRQHMGWATVATAAAYIDHDRRNELDEMALGLDDEL